MGTLPVLLLGALSQSPQAPHWQPVPLDRIKHEVYEAHEGRQVEFSFGEREFYVDILPANPPSWSATGIRWWEAGQNGELLAELGDPDTG